MNTTFYAEFNSTGRSSGGAFNERVDKCEKRARRKYSTENSAGTSPFGAGSSKFHHWWGFLGAAKVDRFRVFVLKERS
jgi:hypothetical protein